MKKYQFQARVINKPAKNLKQLFKDKKESKKHNNCKVCQHLRRQFTCEDRFLVYQFNCKYCSKFYIGETSRPFNFRFKEHERCIKQTNLACALAEHAIMAHNSDLSIDDFDLDIIRKCKSPVETRLAEARAIGTLRPQLNRKHEIGCFSSLPFTL